MPRTRRASVGGICYHVINRGNRKARVFHGIEDYRSFTALISCACRRTPMRVLAYCLMPNHFHLVLWPLGENDLSRWMQWLLTTHVRRYHLRRGTNGRVWQGRFKAFPIQQDHHLLKLLRYVERNPVRANLVKRAEEWSWSSIRQTPSGTPPAFLHEGPVPKFLDWLRYVNEPQTEAELEAIRTNVNRERPFGDDEWAWSTAAELGLLSSLREAGRPQMG